MIASGHQSSYHSYFQNLEVFLQSNDPQHWDLAIQLLQALPEDTQIGHWEVDFFDLNGYRQAALFVKHGFVKGLKYLKVKKFYLSKLYPHTINVFPLALTHLTSLESLDLSNCLMTTLPAEIKQMTNLRTLNLANNRLTRLPPEIGCLKKLESLNLSGNQLTCLPPEIGQVKKLSHLSLVNNKLQELPQEIECLKKLQMLQLEANPMLTNETGRMRKLLRHNVRAARERYWKILIQR